ncbi:hypothetical protein K435DRAFT_802919 [Dendrothele bispora CBS 962.96]|uniref:Uncharacterized protein n=1 Tax=Dendrothele bispora (strain CBS 962.96) TaxID=1314807 RepID=A0A4S8LJ77_DENBC|nr:hypothetical protein K435DRAFT_802919 [Dendrothele bispora CBS 962.96]
MLDNSKLHAVYLMTDDIHNLQDFLQSIAFEGLFYGFITGIQSVFYTMTLFIFSFYHNVPLFIMFVKDLVDIILQIKSFPDTSSSVEMQLWFGGHGFYLTRDQSIDIFLDYA